MNMSDRHLLLKGGESIDVLIKVKGPVVQDLLQVFAEDWFFVTNEDLRRDPVFSRMDGRGKHWCQVIESSPDQDRFVYHEALVTAIHRAESCIDLVTPYYVPDPAVSDALNLAVRRGVQVRLIVPEKPDMKLLRFATDDHIRGLLRAGGTVMRRPGPMLHMKLGVFDNQLVLLGSSNLDQRSFFLNFELDLAVYGEEFAASVTKIVELQVSESVCVPNNSIKREGWFRYFFMRLASMFSPIL
jgi:cardiolipin synthase